MKTTIVSIILALVIFIGSCRKKKIKEDNIKLYFITANHKEMIDSTTVLTKENVDSIMNNIYLKNPIKYRSICAVLVVNDTIRDHKNFIVKPHIENIDTTLQRKL